MKNRPLSPHLSIYKWDIPTMLVSILHRVTTMYVFFLTITFAVYVTYLAQIGRLYGEFGIFTHMIESFKNALHCDCFIMKFVVYSFVFGTILAVVFNILSGFRYFIWSFCKGFNIKFVNITGYLICIVSIVCSIVFGIKFLKLLC